MDSANDLVVIVCNGMKADDCQYTATKKDTLDWRPIKPLDWSCPVKLINNVKAAHELAEKLFRRRTTEYIKKEYNRCDLVIVYMKEKLVDKDVKTVEEELNSMKTKIKSWTQDIHKVEKSQGKLRQQLQNLGIDIATFAKPGQKIVPGFQQLPHDTAKLLTAAQASENVDVHLNPFIQLKHIKFVEVGPKESTEVAKESVSAQEKPQQELKQLISDQQQLMDTAEQETPQSVMDVVTPDLSVVKQIPPDNIDLNLWLPPPPPPPLPPPAAATDQPITYTPIFPYAPQAQEGVRSVSSMETTPQVVQAGVVTPQTAALQKDAQIGIIPQGKSTRWGRV